MSERHVASNGPPSVGYGLGCRASMLETRAQGTQRTIISMGERNVVVRGRLGCIPGFPII